MNGERIFKASFWAFLSSALILMTLNCERDMTAGGPSTPLYTTTIVIPDPLGKRAGDYRLETHSKELGFWLECDGIRPCLKEVLSEEDLPLGDKNWRELVAFDFSRFAYDLIVVTLPDPSHYSQLIGKKHRDDALTLEFGVYRSPGRGAVPMVIVPEWYLFRYAK